MNGPVSIIAIAVSSGADIPVVNFNTQHLIYSGFHDGSPSISKIPKEKATQFVQNMRGTKLAVTVSNSQIQSFLNEQGCTGIRLTQDITQHSKIFQLTPATVSQNSIVNIANEAYFKPDNACPPACGGTDAYLSGFIR